MEGGGVEGSGMKTRDDDKDGEGKGGCVYLIKSRGEVHHGGGRRESGRKGWGENLGDGGEEGGQREGESLEGETESKMGTGGRWGKICLCFVFYLKEGKVIASGTGWVSGR